MNTSRLTLGLAGLVLLTIPCALRAQDERLRISGYGNAHYMDHDGTPKLLNEADLDDGFLQLREFALFLDYAINDSTIISTEIEAADNGTRYTANYAYLDYEVSDSFRFRVGKILVPFLAYNENKPNYHQFLMSQPFTAFQLAPVNGTPIIARSFGWSDAGVVADWSTELGETGVFNVKASVINGIGSDSTVLDDNSIQLNAGAMTPVVRPRDGLIQNRAVNDLRDNNSDLATTLKLTYANSEFPLTIGLSIYRGAWDPDGKQDLDMYGAHVSYMEEDWTIKGEFVLAEVEQAAGTLLSGHAPISLNFSTGDYQMKAWYLEASVVPFRWEGQDETDRFLRLIARYDAVDTNNKVGFTPFHRTRVTLGSEWQFESNARFRVEWQRNNISSFYNAPGPYVGAGGKDHVDMFMASVIFWF